MRATTAVLLLVLASAAVTTQALNLNGVECPSNTITLTPGADLSGIQAGNTYLLSAGDYSVQTEVARTTAESEALCVLGLVQDRSLVRINVHAGFSWTFTDVGMASLTLIGSSNTPQKSGASLPQIVFQFGRFVGIHNVRFTGFAHGALFLIGQEMAMVSSTVFDNNNGHAVRGGAVNVMPNYLDANRRPRVLLHQVSQCWVVLVCARYQQLQTLTVCDGPTIFESKTLAWCATTADA